MPDPVPKDSSLDLTSHKQDVVQIAIEPESSPAGLIPDNGNRPMHLDNSHTIEIEADGLLIRMSNEIKPLLLKMLMDTLFDILIIFGQILVNRPNAPYYYNVEQERIVVNG